MWSGTGGEQLLHNQSALRLKARLLFQPGVMVTNVPWQLGSAEVLEARREGTSPDGQPDQQSEAHVAEVGR